MESALSHHGWIPEAVYACTCASFANSREFATPLGAFSYRRVPQNAFFLGVDRCKDANGNVFFMATAAKALADYLYMQKLNWSGMDAASDVRWFVRANEQPSLNLWSKELFLEQLKKLK